MHINDDDLEMYFLEALSSEENSAVTLHLANCAACQNKLIEAVRLPGKVLAITDPTREGLDRRSSARIMTDISASIRCLRPTSSGRFECRVIDISRDGLRLRTPEFLHPGATIEIRQPGATAIGEVRHCRPAGSAFHVGVRILDRSVGPLDVPFTLKREQLRSPVNIPVELFVDGGTDSQAATIRDISKSGVRVRTKIGVAIGTPVWLIHERSMLLGEISHLREVSSEEFDLGISARTCVRDATAFDDDIVDVPLLFHLNLN